MVNPPVCNGTYDFQGCQPVLLTLSGINLSAPSLQKVGAPGPSMRSGRISKLTERFIEYKSQKSDVKVGAESQKMECDPELADVVAALCDLGQSSV